MNTKLLARKINPLALPKGTEKFCELCERVAHLQCLACEVTYYCNAEHQYADWVGIHNRICQLLIPFRDPERRDQLWPDKTDYNLKKIQLIEMCRSEAQNKLSEGKHYEALPPAHACLQNLIDVYGSGTFELVPAYFLLAEVNMGLGNVTLVKELLSQAEWVVINSPDCTNEIHHQLHRSLGRVHVLTGDLDAALYNFANDIYYAAEAFGLGSTVISHGYFLMADVFLKQGKMPVARSLYSEVVELWHNHLTELLQTHIQDPDFSYDESKQVEVDRILQTILEFDQKDSRDDWAQEARLNHCLAILWILGGDIQKAAGFGNAALQASQLIPNHDLAESIRGLLQLVQGPQTDQHPSSDLSSHCSLVSDQFKHTSETAAPPAKQLAV